MTVRVVVDARKAPPGSVEWIALMVERYPGEEQVEILLCTSMGERILLLGDSYRVEAGEKFFGAIRTLGWAAIPV